MLKKQSAHAAVAVGARVGRRERKELTPNGAAGGGVDGVGFQRMQPRAGAGRAISPDDGTSNDCVDVYVRYWIFLLKRTPADTVLRDGSCVPDATGGFSAASRSDAGGTGVDFNEQVGVGTGSAARACAASADVSGAKRFAGCSGATLELRVVRCDAMCERCTWREDSGSDGCARDAGVDADTGDGVSVSDGCDFDIDECPLGTGPLRMLGPAGPPSLFSPRWCSPEHSVPAPRT